MLDVHTSYAAIIEAAKYAVIRTASTSESHAEQECMFFLRLLLLECQRAQLRGRSLSKSVNTLFELGSYPLPVSPQARGVMRKEDFGIKGELVMEGRSCPMAG